MVTDMALLHYGKCDRILEDITLDISAPGQHKQIDFQFCKLETKVYHIT